MTDKKIEDDKKCNGSCAGCCPFAETFNFENGDAFEPCKCLRCKESRSMKGGGNKKDIDIKNLKQGK